MSMSDYPQGYDGVSTNIQFLLRELSGPRPLRRGKDFVSKPHIWNPAPWPFSFETQSSSQITGGGKDGNLTYFNPTTCWCHLDAWSSSSVGPHDVEVPRYRAINLG